MSWEVIVIEGSEEAGQPSTVQGLWVGSRLSRMEMCSISSFLQNGHPYDLYVYDEVEGVPDGAVLRDAEAILPASKIFKYPKEDSVAGFANLFRYKLLFDKGGIWVDTDMVCLKRLPENELMFAAQRQYRKRQVNNCLIKSPPGSPIMQQAYEVALAKDVQTLYWGETGPDLLTELIRKLNLEHYVYPPKTFNPIDWWRWEVLIKDDPVSRFRTTLATRESYTVHLWNEMWRRANLDKQSPFPPECLYERLIGRYIVSSPGFDAVQ